MSFYLAAVLSSLYFLFELGPAYVLLAWSLLCLAGVTAWFKTEHQHARMAAILLALALLIRAFTVHFQTGNGFLGRPNLWVIPLSTGALILSYCQACLGRERSILRWFLPKVSHSFWFFAMLALWIGFIEHETAGTTFTIWLSLSALGGMAMGFGFKDRAARLTAMSLLLFCVFKLFLYDLRGLHGLWRILSFMVLGAVLIAVSYSYTRFRNRWSKFL